MDASVRPNGTDPDHSPLVSQKSLPQGDPMPRIITALFEDRGAAERALQALIEIGTARDRIAIIGEKHATGTEVAPSRPPAPDENVTAALRGLALPGEDTRLFEAGLRRGCALVSVRVDGGDVDRAIQTL